MCSKEEKVAQKKRKVQKIREKYNGKKRGGEGKSVKSGDAARSVQLPSAVAWID